MELAITPDTYQLSTDDNGNFYDSISYIKNPVICPCGTRINKAFTRKTMSGHIKCKTHKAWVCKQNLNKGSILADNFEKDKLIEKQQKIINKLNSEVNEVYEKLKLLDKKNQVQAVEIDMLKRENISKKID